MKHQPQDKQYFLSLRDGEDQEFVKKVQGECKSSRNNIYVYYNGGGKKGIYDEKIQGKDGIVDSSVSKVKPNKSIL